MLKLPRLAIAATPDSPLGAAGGRLLTGLFGPHLPTWPTWSPGPQGFVPLRRGLAGARGAPGAGAPGAPGPHRRLGPAGLAALLLGEHDRIARTLPAGLAAEVESPTPAARWLPPAIALGMLLLVLWGLSRDRRPAVVDRTVGTINAILAGTTAPADSSLGADDR